MGSSSAAGKAATAELGKNPSPSSSIYSEHELDEIPLQDLSPAPTGNSESLPTFRPDSPTLPPTSTRPSPTVEEEDEKEDEEGDMQRLNNMLDMIEARKGSDASEGESVSTSAPSSSQTGGYSGSSRARPNTAHLTAENKAAFAAYVRGKASHGTYGTVIPESTAPEHCYPEYGVRSNVTADAQIWYAGVRYTINWGITEMKFADGKYIDVITNTYPLRDSLNKIMWDDSLEIPEGAALVRLGRIYARAQGEAKDGVLINRNYIERTGLGDMADCLLEIFHGEAHRRAGMAAAGPSNDTMSQLNATISRLQLEVAHDLKEKEAAAVVKRIAAAEKAAKELIEQEEREKAKEAKRASQASSKSKSKGKKGKGKQ